MRKALSTIGAVAMVLFSAQEAEAHALSCEKTVNGAPSINVDSYPATLHYELTVMNAVPDAESVVLAADDDTLAPFGFAFEPAPPFVLEGGGSVTNTFDLVVESEEDCLALAASDGEADHAFVNTFEVEWDLGAAACSAIVVCQPPAPPPPVTPGGTTRTMGFFKTHEDALGACLAEGPVDLGVFTVASLEEALGILWGSPSRFDDGGKRNNLDKARFLLARQTLVGVCNARLFGAVPDPVDLLDAAMLALAGTDCALILGLAEEVDAFNNAGDDEDLPSGFAPGPATPRHARSIADDPTTPSGEQCGT